jgi:hypothetical protein
VVADANQLARRAKMMARAWVKAHHKPPKKVAVVQKIEGGFSSF